MLSKGGWGPQGGSPHGMNGCEEAACSPVLEASLGHFAWSIFYRSFLRRQPKETEWTDSPGLSLPPQEPSFVSSGTNGRLRLQSNKRVTGEVFTPGSLISSCAESPPSLLLSHPHPPASRASLASTLPRPQLTWWHGFASDG